MLRSLVLKQFYKDLQNPRYITSFAMYHRRYSTNTNPKWPLAQPMRVLGHNGALSLQQCWLLFACDLSLNLAQSVLQDTVLAADVLGVVVVKDCVGATSILEGLSCFGCRQMAAV